MVQNSWLREAKRIENHVSQALRPEIHFVWVPKAAGTSVAKWLRKGVGLQDLPSIRHIRELSEIKAREAIAITFGHQSIDALVEAAVVRADHLAAAYSFAFVRNPFERLVSLWRYLNRLKKIEQPSFDDFVRAIEHQRPTTGLHNLHGLSMASPMVSWLQPTQWAGPREIFRVEELEGAIATLRKKLRITEDFRAYNAAQDPSPMVEISGRSVEFIHEFYSDDFQAYDYPLDPPRPQFKLATNTSQSR